MQKLAICVLGLCWTMPYAFSVESTYDTRGEGQSWLMADNQNAPAMATATGHTKTNEAEALDAQSMATATGHTKTISNGRYIGGGVASIFLGFGIGHAIQGRWGERGWVFTLLDSIAIGGMVTSFISPTVGSHFPTFVVVLYGSFFLLLGSRIWSIIDAWILPSHYKIAQESRFQVSPLIVSNYSDLSTVGLGLGMKYRF